MSSAHALTYTRDIITGKRAVSMIGAAFFIAATALGAFVRIPVPGSPVPITLQTLFVLLSGAVLGRRLGLASMLGYAALSGAFLLGPTGGYIIGFALASYCVGALIERKTPAFAAFIAGSFVIYACGVTWLACIFKTGLIHSVSFGVLPFIPGDAAKCAVAALVYASIAKRSRDIFSL